MAFQRPFLISLKRADSQQKWGFGIHGGKEYGEALKIQTVGEDSLAERFGLREGDEVIQVGRVNVQDLTLSQAYEVLARCGNKIEMFVIREDLLSPRKGKEPPVVKAVVHNPYNSPLSLYSTENIADTLAKQTEVLTEGHVSEEDEGPEKLSFKEKSAVFQLLEEQSKQEISPQVYSRSSQQSSVIKKPKAAPPPPPKPRPPSDEQLFNGYDSTQQRQVYQDQQRSTNRVEYQTTSTQKVVSQYQYQQEQPVQYQQSSVYQTSSYQKSPGHQSPSLENYQSLGYQSSVNNYQQPAAYQSRGHHQAPGYQSPVQNYQQSPNYQPAARNYQQSYQQLNQSNYQQQQGHTPPAPVAQQQQYSGYQSPSATTYQQPNPGYQSPSATTYQQLNQSNYQDHQNRGQVYNTNQQFGQQSQTQHSAHQTKKSQGPTSSVSKAEFKIGPPPPPRGSSAKQDTSNMTAVYRQQYEQHLQQQYEQQQMLMNNFDNDESLKPKAHIIKEDIFENNSSSGAPITYKAPPVAPPKPHWPPPPQENDLFRPPAPPSPSGMKTVGSVWPPKKPTVTELPKTGFNPAAVREQGTGRRCIWPPQRPEDEMRSGRNTPQSPLTGRRIQFNPSPSPPQTRRTVFSSSESPSRRKDIQWPPPSPTNMDKENFFRPSPKMTRKARFDDYIHEHASINVPQTYRPPPGTQHVEFH